MLAHRSELNQLIETFNDDEAALLLHYARTIRARVSISGRVSSELRLYRAALGYVDTFHNGLPGQHIAAIVELAAASRGYHNAMNPVGKAAHETDVFPDAAECVGGVP